MSLPLLLFLSWRFDSIVHEQYLKIVSLHTAQQEKPEPWILLR